MQRCTSLCGIRSHIMFENITLERPYRQLPRIKNKTKTCHRSHNTAPSESTAALPAEENSSRKSHNWDNYNFIIMMSTGRLISFRCIIYTTMLLKSARLQAKLYMYVKLHFMRFRRPSATAYPESDLSSIGQGGHQPTTPTRRRRHHPFHTLSRKKYNP